VPWITLVQERDKCQAVVNVVMNCGCSSDFEEGIRSEFCKSFCENLSVCSEISLMDCTVGKN
jgi:hypothetical protein